MSSDQWGESIASQFAPLDHEERELFKECLAQEPLVNQVIGYLGYCAGLQLKTISHMRPRWIESGEKGLVVRVPASTYECDLGDDGGPCYDCRRFSDGQLVFRESPRGVPVRDSDAIEAIESYFSLYDRVMSPSGARKLPSRRWQPKMGISPLNFKTLRNTFRVRLVEYGFSREQIKEIAGLETIRAVSKYGKYVDGPNPFRCQAETNDGCQCPHGVPREHDDCRIHRADGLSDNVYEEYVEYTCEAVLDDGTQCGTPISEPDERCLYHRDDAPMCGAVKADGDQCKTPVSEPDTRCVFHQDSQTICGAETQSGTCQMPVSGADETCHYHSGHTCNAPTNRGGSCQRSVDGPDERCSLHSD
jgi:hypothetical protein